MGKVFYVKFQNGEELIAELFRKGDEVVLQDPMTIEYGESDGRKFIFMGRFNPFLEDKTIMVKRSSVLFMKPVMAEVSSYYYSSLEYAKNVADRSFKEGMVQASKFANEMVDEDSMDMDDEIIVSSEIVPSSNTVH